jgi:hypothetical protein
MLNTPDVYLGCNQAESQLHQQLHDLALSYFPPTRTFQTNAMFHVPCIIQTYKIFIETNKCTWIYERNFIT